MPAVWKGAISFGLVNIPVALHSAVRRDEVKFRLLRKADRSPVQYKRVAEIDGKDVPWADIVKGYEYEAGNFVVVEEEDFRSANPDASQTIQITDFVALNDIDPIHFDKPYYLEPLKGANVAYGLLRDVMTETQTVGIAKVVIKTRQHLAALKPSGNVLLISLMHFASDIVDSSSIAAPPPSTKTKEYELAKALVGQMTAKWEPAKYTDDYKTTLLAMIEKKVQQGSKAARHRAPKNPVPPNVVDMVALLQKSLSKAHPKKAVKPRSRSRHRVAA